MLWAMHDGGTPGFIITALERIQQRWIGTWIGNWPSRPGALLDTCLNTQVSPFWRIEESLLALETFILTLWPMHQILVIIQKQDQSIILNAII
jgi:hypothetical protein